MTTFLLTGFKYYINDNFKYSGRIGCEISDNQVRFSLNGISTRWMGIDDPFIERIDKNNLNPNRLADHLVKEMEIKNALDEALTYLDNGKYPKAIEKLDEVLYYDPDYAEALMVKSHVLFAQKHFVKSLRHYRHAVKADESLKDNDYYRLLLKSANDERSNFPKLKLNIYAGDEHFSRGEYEKAVESYDKALANPSRFKEKILSKLLNKKGSALLKLGEYEGAYGCFKKSNNDFSHFGQGVCEHHLGLEINEKFKRLLIIDKKHQLRQAVILDEMGFSDEAMDICSHLYENHFRCDDLYRQLTGLMGRHAN